MKQLLIFGLSVLLLSSCKKDNLNGTVSRLYTENSPVAGRSQLNFISNNLVVKIETDNAEQDTFSYALSPGKISLTPIWTNDYPATSFDFTIIDNNTFQIQNLYASIPEAPESYMIFKK